MRENKHNCIRTTGSARFIWIHIWEIAIIIAHISNTVADLKLWINGFSLIRWCFFGIGLFGFCFWIAHYYLIGFSIRFSLFISLFHFNFSAFRLLQINFNDNSNSIKRQILWFVNQNSTANCVPHTNFARLIFFLLSRIKTTNTKFCSARK